MISFTDTYREALRQKADLLIAESQSREQHGHGMATETCADCDWLREHRRDVEWARLTAAALTELERLQGVERDLRMACQSRDTLAQRVKELEQTIRVWADAAKATQAKLDKAEADALARAREVLEASVFQPTNVVQVDRQAFLDALTAAFQPKTETPHNETPNRADSSVVEQPPFKSLVAGSIPAPLTSLGSVPFAGENSGSESRKPPHSTTGRASACDEHGRSDSQPAEPPPAVDPVPEHGIYGSEVLCEHCAVTFCPHGERLHFHHDGCPACDATDSSAAFTGSQEPQR